MVVSSRSTSISEPARRDRRDWMISYSVHGTRKGRPVRPTLADAVRCFHQRNAEATASKNPWAPRSALTLFSMMMVIDDYKANGYSSTAGRGGSATHEFFDATTSQDITHRSDHRVSGVAAAGRRRGDGQLRGCNHAAAFRLAAKADEVAQRPVSTCGWTMRARTSSSAAVCSRPRSPAPSSPAVVKVAISRDAGAVGF